MPRVDLTNDELELVIDCVWKVVGDWEYGPGELDHLRALAEKLESAKTTGDDQ